MSLCSNFITIAKISDGEQGVGIVNTIISYALSDSGNTYPDDGWQANLPEDFVQGKYLWTRTIINYSNGNYSDSYSVSYISIDGTQGDPGPKGEDAIPPKYQWRLGSSSTEPPVDTINHLADGAVSTFDGTVLAETNTGWLDVRPTPTNDLPYIWERMSADGGLTWSAPYCLSINTIKNIEVIPSHTSFNLNSRGVCDTLQTITCSIVRSNTIDPCFWTVTKDSNLTDIVATEGDSITFSVAVGETTKNIEVSAVCSGMARAVNIFSKIVGKIVPVNLTHELKGHYNDTVDIPKVFKDGITPVMKGDYIIYYPIDSEGKEYPTPAVYNGSAWLPVETETAPDNYSQIMSDTLPDVLASGITVPVVSAYYGYFENLAAQAAVITKLFSKFIKISGAIYGGAYDEYGNNTTGGAGFYLGNDGLFRAIDATLDKVMIKGELISSYLSTIVPADRIYTINMTTPTTYVYRWETVKRSFEKFMDANMEVKEGNVYQATGYYSGIEYTSIEFSKGGSYARATVENKVFKWPIFNTRIGVPYVDFNKIWSMTYNGNTFTSDDPQFKEVEFTDVQAQELSIIEQNKQYKAIGTVEGGGKKIVATEDHPMYIKRYAEERYSFTQDGTEIYFYVSGYTKAPASVNISFYENLEGVSVHNLFRNSAESSIGHSLKPFKEAHVTSVNSTNITATGTINITGSGTINGPKVWGAVFN